jgi:hypothetical protein
MKLSSQWFPIPCLSILSGPIQPASLVSLPLNTSTNTCRLNFSPVSEPEDWSSQPRHAEGFPLLRVWSTACLYCSLSPHPEAAYRPAHLSDAFQSSLPWKILDYSPYGRLGGVGPGGALDSWGGDHGPYPDAEAKVKKYSGPASCLTPWNVCESTTYSADEHRPADQKAQWGILVSLDSRKHGPRRQPIHEAPTYPQHLR